MDREIKFRGLNTKGEWVYGSLVTTTYGLNHKQAQHTKTWIVESAFGNGGWFNVTRRQYVKPETVGQFTWLHDRNGNEIYEGDIVKVMNPYDGCWSKGGGKVIFSTKYVGGWVITSDGNDALNIGTRTEHVKVIGNIFENPSLLEEKP